MIPSYNLQLDRGFLDACAERYKGGLIVDVGCGPGQVASSQRSFAI